VVRRNTRTVGNAAEELAYQYLRTRGLRPVERNFRCRHGEIDLIMLDRGCLVFVEVRFRSSGAFSSAAVTVDGRKQSKLVRTAEMFLATRPGFSSRAARFDVVGVDSRANGRRTVEWIRDAFVP
jgi:putative endonuclease